MFIIHFTRSSEKGGASKIMFSLLNGLRYDTKIIHWVDKFGASQFNAFLTKDIYLKLKKYRLSSFTLSKCISIFFRFFRPIYLVIYLHYIFNDSKKNIYHFHYASAIRDAYWMSIFGYKIVFTLHQVPEVSMYKYLRLASKFPNFKLVCVSKYLESLLIIGGIKNIETIKNGLSFNNNLNLVPRRILNKNSLLFIGCVSRFNYEKGIDILINAIELLVVRHNINVKCTILGDGPLYNYYLDDVNKRNLSNNIIMPGFKSNITSYLSNVDIYVQPSRKETFSLSLLEAINIGLRCIVSDDTGMVEILNGLGKTFKNGISSDLSDKILKVFENDTEFANPMKLNFHSKKYDVSNMLKQYDTIYQNLKD